MDSDVVKFRAGIIAVIAFLIWGANELTSISCFASTKYMNTKTEYGFFEGCLVADASGKMIPLDVYRNVEIPNKK